MVRVALRLWTLPKGGERSGAGPPPGGPRVRLLVPQTSASLRGADPRPPHVPFAMLLKRRWCPSFISPLLPPPPPPSLATHFHPSLPFTASFCPEDAAPLPKSPCRFRSWGTRPAPSDDKPSALRAPPRLRHWDRMIRSGLPLASFPARSIASSTNACTGQITVSTLADCSLGDLLVPSDLAINAARLETFMSSPPSEFPSHSRAQT